MSIRENGKEIHLSRRILVYYQMTDDNDDDGDRGDDHPLTWQKKEQRIVLYS